MIIPLNFVVGAAAGAVTTYVLKDSSAKKWIKDTGSKVGNKVTGVFKKKSKEDSVEDVVTGEVIEGKAKDVTDKATASA